MNRKNLFPLDSIVLYITADENEFCGTIGITFLILFCVTPRSKEINEKTGKKKFSKSGKKKKVEKKV